jgi:hypothetical protein
MRYLWLVGLVAVAGLVLAAGLRAEVGAPAGEGVKHEHKAPEGAAGARGERTRAPAVTLTAKQEEALAPAVKALKTAIADFKAAAVKELGEKDGRAYMTQTIFGIMRAERPAAPTAPKTEGATEGGTK